MKGAGTLIGPAPSGPFSGSPPPYVKEQLCTALPDLFTSAHKSALYAGASRGRQRFPDDFIAACGRVAILEAFPESARLLKEAFGGQGRASRRATCAAYPASSTGGLTYAASGTAPRTSAHPRRPPSCAT